MKLVLTINIILGLHLGGFSKVKFNVITTLTFYPPLLTSQHFKQDSISMLKSLNFDMNDPGSLTQLVQATCTLLAM